MPQIILPPTPPLRAALGDSDGHQRLRQRLWLLWMTILTVIITAWICMLGPLPAVIALVVAKHILVALLVMGLGVDAKEPTG